MSCQNERENLHDRVSNEIPAHDTTGMDKDVNRTDRLFLNEGTMPDTERRIERSLKNEHRVAVAVEPIPPPHGISIDGEDLLAARKRRREDQQRRLRQMEVGDQAGHELEAMTGANEQARLTISRPHDSLVRV